MLSRPLDINVNIQILHYISTKPYQIREKEKHNETDRDWAAAVRRVLNTIVPDVVNHIYIIRCHRKGRYVPGQTRPIICKFYPEDREHIWDNKTVLKGSNFFIAEDFPFDVEQSRKILFPIFLTKAFDTVNHEILLYKLYRYGIRGHANNFFRSYLTERKQYTCINCVNSSTKQINCGVPHGSVLGPLFFILYINDIINVADANNIRLYADDTRIFLHNRNINNLVGHARTYLRKLFKWFTCNKLTVNGNKPYFTVFHTKKKDVPEELQSIEIDDIEIQRSYSVKYIGLHIDEKLKWDVRIDSLIKSSVKYFGIFNHIKDYVSTHLARQMYYAFVYSRINYGVEVYSLCSNKLMDKVQVVQNKLLKLLLRRHPRSSTNELHNDLGYFKSTPYQWDICNNLCFQVFTRRLSTMPKELFQIRHKPMEQDREDN